MLRVLALFLVSGPVFAAAPQAGVVPAGRGLDVLSGIDRNGGPTQLWVDMVRQLRGAESDDPAVLVRRPLGGGERAWEALILSRAAAWSERRRVLAEPFEPVAPPRDVRIVFGNRGGEDAFTHDARTIGFDLSRLEGEYGDAHDPENLARIDRFFAHEYTHLLQKAWLADHPQPQTTPFERAELGIWLEGLGNYYSLSPRWRSRGRAEAEPARAALAELEPVFVERMKSLACASPEQEAAQIADLSMGPFSKKWGALPAALWLDRETRTSPAALRDFVQGGTASALALASRHLPHAARAELEAARERSRSCPTPGGEAGAGSADPQGKPRVRAQ